MEGKGERSEKTKEEMGEGKGGYSQSIVLSCVKEKMNSSITRSTPTVRETSSRWVSVGLLKMKWSR